MLSPSPISIMKQDEEKKSFYNETRWSNVNNKMMKKKPWRFYPRHEKKKDHPLCHVI
jgi:hypothetical protein